MESRWKKSSFGVVLTAFLSNLSIAIFKFLIALITNSSSLFSEAIHSLADTTNQIFLFIGMKKGSKKEDRKHPFGYGQEEFFWAFIVAIQIFLLGGIFSIISGVKKLSHPENLKSAYLAILLILFSIIAESISLNRAYREIKKEIGNNKNLRKYLVESYRVEVIVVFLEDVSAILGLTVALFSILLTMIFKDPIFDVIGSLIIGLILIVISFLLGRKMKSLIIDESAPKDVVDGIEKILKSSDLVKRIISTKSIVIGVNKIIVISKIAFKKDAPTGEITKEIDSLESKVRKKFPEVKSIYIEPN